MSPTTATLLCLIIGVGVGILVGCLIERILKT